MMRINDKLASNWPCTTLYFCGYACMPCTLGLSLCCPNFCISEAEVRCALRLIRQCSRDLSVPSAPHLLALAMPRQSQVKEEIEQMNRTDIYRKKGISFRLRKTCFHSWIEIHYPA